MREEKKAVIKIVAKRKLIALRWKRMTGRGMSIRLVKRRE